MSKIDVSKIIVTKPSHVQTPVRNGIPDTRLLCPPTTKNTDVLVKKYTDVPKSVCKNCFPEEELSKHYTKDELFSRLCEVMIRFDTDPENYLKDDYYKLIALLKDAMIANLDDSRLNKLENFINQLRRLIPHYEVTKLKDWNNIFVDKNYNPIEIEGVFKDYFTENDSYESSFLGEELESEEAISTLSINAYGYLKFTIYIRIDEGSAKGECLSVSLDNITINKKTSQPENVEYLIRGSDDLSKMEGCVLVANGIWYKKITFDFRKRLLRPINILFKRPNRSSAKAKVLIPKILLAPDVIEIEDINNIFN